MKIKTPWIKFLPQSLVVNIATLGPLGFLGKAPGTNGTLAGLIFYTVFFYGLSFDFFFLLEILFIYLAIAFCGAAEIFMRKKDPGQIILDEFVAIPLCFIGTQPIMDRYGVWLIILLSFCLFRFFDILKPLGIRQLQKLEGGLGIVMDDIAAAIATCVSIHIGFLLWNRFVQ